MLEMKAAVLVVWRRFTFLPGSTTREPLVMEPTSNLTVIQGSVWANIARRQL